MANISSEKKIFKRSHPHPNDHTFSPTFMPTKNPPVNPRFPVKNFNMGTGDSSKKYRNKFWWWQPEQDAIASEFLELSSMHGLKYASQPKRHLIERLLWVVAFVSCVVGAIVMICEIWQRYYDNPVIMRFSPAEIDVDVIPFPAITVCNISPFKRSRVIEFEKIYKQSPDKRERDKALDALRLINALCSAQPSFLETQDFSESWGKMTYPEANKSPSKNLERNITQFLLENTQPCSELLQVCVWDQENIDCDKLFKNTVTDYGKCCTFNMLPPELLENSDGLGRSRGAGNKKSSSPMADVDEWSKWNYGADGYIINQELKYPRRQRRAGALGGLTLLIDPDIENGFCPSTDSAGVKILYHVPIEAPSVADLGLVVGTDREVFLEVNPDLTIAEDGIESYSRESRKCYFGRKYKLEFYKPYTRSNCLNECWNALLLQNCSCVPYYAPRNDTANVCSTNIDSSDYNCVKENEKKFLGRIRRICDHCMYSCNHLEYNSKVTQAQLQKPEKLWGGVNNETVDWINRSVSIVHVFMGVDSTVPKLRQKLYQTVDLIANTGGLLGLSIGFSVLSAVEIIYFATMRFCCKRLNKSKRFGQPSEEASRYWRAQSK